MPRSSDGGGAGAPRASRPFRFRRRSRRVSLSPFRPFHLWKGKHFAPLAGILLGLLVFLLGQTQVGQMFELRTLDLRFQHRGDRPVASNLAIVFIGDDAIRGIGRWPWNWEWHALLVDVLRRHGARAVIFDVVFAEVPSGGDPDIFPLTVGSAGNVYLSAYFNQMEPSTLSGMPHLGSELTEPVPALRDAARGVGHCNAIPDADGVTRRVPLLVRYSDGYYPSTALKVALDLMGVPLSSLEVSPDKWIEVPGAPGGRLRIPIDGHGQTLVDFAGGVSSFEAYSFLQVLQADRYPERGLLDLENFRGKTVLIGATFAGNTDLRPTPLSTAYPMLCILGNALDNILQDRFVHRAPFAARLLLAILLGALTGFLAYVLRPFFSLAAAVLLGAGMVLLTFWVFGRHLLWLDLVAPLGIILANYLAMTTTLYIQNRREKLQYFEHLKYTNDLVETSNDAIVSFDPDGAVATWNRGAGEIFGWNEREALGKHWSLLVSPESREEVGGALRGVLDGGTPRGLEVNAARKGGAAFPVSMNLSAVTDSHGTMVGVSCISLDLTEKKRMIELLVQSEKMAELGRLGSGIVHEIKNPLTSIMMLTGMVLGAHELDPKTRKYIGIIDQEAQRILRLSQNILSFARPKKPEMKAVDINRVIEETLSLVEYELKRNKVTLDLRPAEGGVTALGDDEKLRQVFLNLIINAVHAMAGGGQLTIATVEEAAGPLPEVPEGAVSRVVGTFEGDRRAVISVRDEGTGIPPELLDRVFEAFFSTKAEGKGTGLGLFICQNIIIEHRGLLMVVTRPGAGTSFHIVLPVPAATPEPPGEPAPAPAA